MHHIDNVDNSRVNLTHHNNIMLIERSFTIHFIDVTSGEFKIEKKNAIQLSSASALLPFIN
jgi:hypothetical protein